MTTPSQEFEPVFKAIEAHRAQYANRPDVVNLRPGYRRTGGKLHLEPAIVISVARKQATDLVPHEHLLPKQIDGIPVDVVTADPTEKREDTVAEWRRVLADGPVAEAATQKATVIGYKPPPKSRAELKPVKVRSVLCHIGPDAGWRTLQPYLKGTQSQLTVAMYELSANYIVDTLLDMGKNGHAKMEMILQEGAAEAKIISRVEKAWTDARFEFAKAVVSGPHRIFANSYHTKVAVRDGHSMWLSSGNWSPHSQPDVKDVPNPTVFRAGNREWHVIVTDDALSHTFAEFIKWDREQAAAVAGEESAPVMPDLLVPESALIEAEAAVVQPALFQPKLVERKAGEPAIQVEPLMTPDNYGPAILDLIKSAKKTLFMQYAYVRGPKNPDLYRDLVKAVAGRMQAGVDVRVIVDGRNEQDKDVDTVLALGWKRDQWLRQISMVHNKGILVDGKIAVVGSQNWSSDGTQINRDASLIFHDEEIAAYFDTVFQFDWKNLTKPIDTQEVVPLVAEAGQPTPKGMVRIPWSRWYDEYPS